MVDSRGNNPVLPTPFGASVAAITALAEGLKASNAPDVQTRTASDWLRVLNLDAWQLLLALVDLRASVEDLTPANGYPRSAKGVFEQLLRGVTDLEPETRARFRPAVDQLVEHPDPLAVDALSVVYELDFRLPSCLQRREGRVSVDQEKLRNMVVSQLAQNGDIGLIPEADFSAFAEMYVSHVAHRAIEWFEGAYSRPIDPSKFAGIDTLERIEHLFEDGDLNHYRKYLGKQPPADLIEVASERLDTVRALALADRLRSAAGKRWKAAGRRIQEALAPQ